MENFALRLFNEDIQAVVDFLGHRITIDRQITIEDFLAESRDEIRKLPTSRLGKPMISAPSAVAYFGSLENCWAYKIIATNNDIHVFYLTFIPSGRFINYQEVMVLEKEWQVLLTRRYNKEYLEYVSKSRKATHDEMKRASDEKLYRYRRETEELINYLSVTAFPISERK